jgi:carnitine O-acetyltransferase
MDDPLVDAVTRRARFRAAEAKHVERVRDCQAGHAPEQHLQELWFIQQRSGAAVGVPVEPELYRTPGWRVLRENYLSTGPTSSPSAEYFGFGPAGRKDIGVGYVLQPDRCQMYLSAHTAVAKEVRAFARHLRTAVAEMRELLADQ